MDTLLKEFEDMGFKVEVGCKEKRRKKTIFESIKKLKESGDDDKIIYAKKLYRYYSILNSMGYILNPKQIPFKEDKYGIHYLCSYLDSFVITAKMSNILLVLLKLLEMMSHWILFVNTLCLLICILQSK